MIVQICQKQVILAFYCQDILHELGWFYATNTIDTLELVVVISP